MHEKDFSMTGSNFPCAFCVMKLSGPCQLCPEWPEEFIEPEAMTAEFIAERAKFLDKSPFTPPLSN